MRLHVLFGQMKQSYPGEYTPDALEVMTGVGFSENPDFLLEKLAAAEKDGAYEAVRIIALEVDGPTIDALLNPPTPIIPAKILT